MAPLTRTVTRLVSLQIVGLHMCRLPRSQMAGYVGRISPKALLSAHAEVCGRIHGGGISDSAR